MSCLHALPTRSKMVNGVKVVKTYKTRVYKRERVYVTADRNVWLDVNPSDETCKCLDCGTLPTDIKLTDRMGVLEFCNQ